MVGFTRMSSLSGLHAGGFSYSYHFLGSWTTTRTWHSARK